MLMIRLARVGKKKHPTYRVVLQEKQKAVSSNVLETLGHYTPHTNPATLEVQAERVRYWMSKGAQLTDTLHNVFVEQKIIEGKKRTVSRGSKKRAADAAKAAEDKKAEEKAATKEAAAQKPAEPKEEKPVAA